MLNVSQSGKGIPIPPSQILTIKRNDPVSQSEDLPQIFKKRLISYPNSRKIPSYSALASEVNHAKREYEDQLQAREAFEDVADFEKRIFGKKLKQPPPINITPPNSDQLSLLRTLGPPSPTKFYDIYDNTSKSCPVSSQEQRIQLNLASLPYSQKSAVHGKKSKNSNESESNTQKVRPAVWTLLDEPIIPLHSNIQYKPERAHKKPFYSMSTNSGNQGIPAITPGFNEYNKKQNQKFEETIRSQFTSENLDREKQLQQRVQLNMQKMREKHEKTSKLIVESGQDWPQRLITQEQIKKIQESQPKPKPLSRDDLEALEFLEKRDDQMWHEMKEKEKEQRLEMKIKTNETPQQQIDDE